MKYSISLYPDVKDKLDSWSFILWEAERVEEKGIYWNNGIFLGHILYPWSNRESEKNKRLIIMA